MVANLFGVGRNLIVPNVHWGLGLHECDILVVTKSGYATEIEIKTNRYDLKRDRLKRHGHQNNKIKRLFFALPEGMDEFWQYIPERAGIIVAKEHYRCVIEKPAKINSDAQPLSVEEIIHLGRLASIRIWSIKQRMRTRGYADPFMLTYDWELGD